MKVIVNTDGSKLPMDFKNEITNLINSLFAPHPSAACHATLSNEGIVLRMEHNGKRVKTFCQQVATPTINAGHQPHSIEVVEVGIKTELLANTRTRNWLR